MPSPTPAPPLVDAAPGTPSLRTLGTGSNQAAAGDDPRFTTSSLPNNVAMLGDIIATPIAAPGTPASNLAKLYVDSTSKAFAVKNDAGVVSHTVQTKGATTHQFLISIADDGTVAAAQPAAADITGLAAVATSGAASDVTGLATIATTGSATNLSGTLQAAQFPALTGDLTTSAGSLTTTLAASGVSANTYGDASHVSQVTFDAKGRATSATAVAIAIAAGAVSGLATVATSGSATDLTGTLPAARLPAFTGDVTTTGGSAATTLANVPSGVTVAGSLNFTPITAPSTPASGHAWVYVDSTSKNLTVKDDAGTIKHGVQTKSSTTHQFLTAISDAGVVSAAQPASTDLSDGTAAGIAVFTGANAAAQRTSLGLVIGTDVQAHSSVLDILATLSPATDTVPYFTSSGAATVATFTSSARTLLAASSTSAQRTALGLGTIATFDAATIAASDVPTIKSYIDGIAVGGVSWKSSVVVATTTAGTLSTSFANGQTIDGYGLVTGDRILIKDQSTGSENGIYVVAASGAPTRATDANTGALLVSAAVFVQRGTANADKAWVCTNDSITIGSTAITFVGFASVVGALVAANNLSDLANAGTARTNLGLVTIASSGSATDLTTGTLAAARLPALSGGDVTSSAGSAVTTLVNIPSDVVMAGDLLASVMAAPATPAAGKARVYVDSTSKNLCVKDDAGTIKHGVQTKTATTHQFLTAISDAGVVSAAQPASSDLSDITTLGTSLVTAVSTSAARTSLGLAIGTDVQAQNANLAAIAGLTSASNKLPYFTGSGTAASTDLTSAGRTVIGGTTLAAILDSISLQSSNLASASTTDLSTMTGDYGHITGTTTINSFGTCAAGVTRVLVFDGVLTITYNATSMILPGAVSYNTTAGDVLTFISEGSGNWRLSGRVTITQQSIVGGSTVSATLLGDDVAVTGMAGALILECSAGYNEVYGLQGGTDGKLIAIRNTFTPFGTGQIVIFAERTSSSASNRFRNGATIYGGQTALFRYNGTSSRWEILATPSSPSALDNTTGSGSGVNGDGAVQFSAFGGGGLFAATPALVGCSPWNILQEGPYDSMLAGGLRTVRRIQEIKGSDIASANDLTLPGWVSGNPSSTSCAGAGNTHAVTGTTTINRILAGDKSAGGWQAGSKITLLFSTVLTLHDGATSGSNFYGLKLRGRMDKETAADLAVSFVFDGSWWIEL